MKSIEADGTLRQFSVDELANGEVEAAAPEGQPYGPTHRLEDGVPEPGDSAGGRLVARDREIWVRGGVVGKNRATE